MIEPIPQTSEGTTAVHPASEHIGFAARDRRRSLGLRQQELADLAGVSVRFIHSLEHDKATVRLDKVLAVFEVLGLDLCAVGPK